MGPLKKKKKVWFLHQLDGTGKITQLTNFPVLIGRSEQCDIQLDDTSVSDQHAQINQAGPNLMLHDLGSTNGVYVKGHRISAIPIEPPEEPIQIQFSRVPFELSWGDPDTLKKAKSATETWYYIHQGVEHGPLDVAGLFAAVDQGRLTKTDQVRRGDMTQPMPATDVSGLFEDEDEAPVAAMFPEADVDFSIAESGAGSLICPSCWLRFDMEQVLFISTHPDQIGDSVLGPDEPTRFLPTRFTPDGLALDARGMRCTDMACPRCHIRIPSIVTRTAPMIYSIVGAPGSGKSYFLASSVWQLRSVLPRFFGCHFSDADAVTNQWLNDYEERLFFQSDNGRLQTIVKTDETAAHVYRSVSLDGMQVFLPLPCVFSFSPKRTGDSSNLVPLVLYDNAGEHFLVGHDHISRPGTLHLVHSDGIMFLFDPLADPRFRRNLTSTVKNAAMGAVHRQDVLLTEMIGRIRKNTNLSEDRRYAKPFVVGVSKADVFKELMPAANSPWSVDAESGRQALDLNEVAKASYRTRHFLLEHAPEVVLTAESFAETVVYVPISALGHMPAQDGVQPDKISPRWVEVPMLYMLAKSGHLPTSRNHLPPPGEPTPYDLDGNILRIPSSGGKPPHEVPWNYCGYEVQCPSSGQTIRVPMVDGAPTI